MTEEEFTRAIHILSTRIARCDAAQRHRFQADLHRLVERALAAGLDVPGDVHRLDDQLTDAAIEAQFDNMPI